jgi:TP901-1 family phage major tail protein
VADTESVGRWRELPDGAGVKTARITGSGIFKDAATDETVRQYFFTGWVGA